MRDGNAKQDTSERPSARRKRLERERMRDAGFVWCQAWVHADDLAKVRKNVKRLRAARMDDDEG